MLKNKESLSVYAICYNEEVLLPHFIQHYKNLGADSITIYDNNSTDNSQKIIYESECNLITYDSYNQIRGDIYMNIKNQCWKFDTHDWVVVCDIDEFLFINDAAMNNLHKHNIVNAQGYSVLGIPPSTLGTEDNAYSKKLLFRPSHYKNINYSAGAHRITPELNLGYGLSGNREICTILHYNNISEEYVLERYKMYEARLSKINKQYNWGHQYIAQTEQTVKARFDELRAKARIIEI